MGQVPRDARLGGLGPLHILALLVWSVLILGASVALATETGFWWLVLIFGAAVPVVLLAQANAGVRAHPTPPAARSAERERELLAVLDRHGEVGPVLVATETTLTVTEADEMLGEMARKGYLEVRIRDGVLAYASPSRRAKGAPPRKAPDPAESDGGATHRAGVAQPPDRGMMAQPLAEPLTERELEVLGLLASGRTNREIAADLFVTVGTIKAHTANIYRKLGARHRAEALARARELNL